MAPTTNQEPLARATGYYEESLKEHNRFAQGVERRYRSYRGLTDDEAKAHHPPFVMRAVESWLASLIDDDLRFTVKQRMMLLDPDAQAKAAIGVKAAQSLSDFQVRASCLSDEQRTFNLQHAIAGLSAIKTDWSTVTETRRHMIPHVEPVQDPNTGGPLVGPDGNAATTTSYDPVTRETVVYDGPRSLTVDIRDFGWHQAAVSLDTARYVWHRVGKDKEDIEKAIDAGQFGPKRGGWDKDEILKGISQGGAGADGLVSREQGLRGTDRWKDKIKVIEVWDRVRREVTTFANNGVLLSHLDKFPFWHNDVPFVICSAQPDMFSIPGISQVEKIEMLQEMLWKLSTQRLLNTELVNNAIFIFGSDQDPDDFPFGPGEQWFMDDPQGGFTQWAPNVIPAEVSVAAEQALMGNMQDLSGGYPYASGATSATVDNTTATGASIISGLAQRSIDMSKAQVYRAWRGVARQRGILNQQFISGPTLVPVTGEDGDTNKPFVVLPEMLAHDFMWDVDPEPSQMRQQTEQASAQALLQIAAQIAPILAAMAQGGMGQMLRLDLLFKNLLDKAGVDDPEQFFAKAPTAAPNVAALAQGNGQQQASTAGGAAVVAPDQINLGTTAPQAADATSPSNGLSLSGMAALQQLQAASGTQN